jgi:hypothetical protein
VTQTYNSLKSGETQEKSGGQPRQFARSHLQKLTREKWTGGMAPEVGALLCKREAQSLNSSPVGGGGIRETGRGDKFNTFLIYCTKLYKCYNVPQPAQQ